MTVDPEDLEELADAMRRVLTNRSLAADTRARGPARTTRFSWAHTAAATVQVYRKVAR